MSAPLAERLRPQTLEDYIGQQVFEVEASLLMVWTYFLNGKRKAENGKLFLFINYKFERAVFMLAVINAIISFISFSNETYIFWSIYSLPTSNSSQ